MPFLFEECLGRYRGGECYCQDILSWDVPGRLLKAGNDTGVQGYYAYDGLGRRVEAKEGSSVTFYSYRGPETLSDQFTSGTSNDHVYADGLSIARTGTYVSTYYYDTDGVGSTRLVTDANRNIAFSDNYKPFGQDNSSSGSETYKFTGKPVSQTAGLYYEYERWYDPSIGRFVSQDPLGGDLSNPQSQNRYVYANNIPTIFTDPTGLAIYANLHPSCPSIFQDFWGSLRCGILGPAPVAGLTGGLGGVGPSVTSPTPAGAIIVAAVSLYWLYVNWDNMEESSGRVEPTVTPTSPNGKVPTTLPSPPDPTLRLPVGHLSDGTPTSPRIGTSPGGSGLGQGTGWTVSFSNGYVGNLRKAVRSPTVGAFCVGGAGFVALGLWYYESLEAARQNIGDQQNNGNP